MNSKGAVRIISGLVLLAGGIWAGWWFFAVFGANLSAPGGLLMGGLMILLPLLGLLAAKGTSRKVKQQELPAVRPSGDLDA